MAQAMDTEPPDGLYSSIFDPPLLPSRHRLPHTVTTSPSLAAPKPQKGPTTFSTTSFVTTVANSQSTFTTITCITTSGVITSTFSPSPISSTIPSMPASAQAAVNALTGGSTSNTTTNTTTNNKNNNKNNTNKNKRKADRDSEGGSAKKATTAEGVPPPPPPPPIVIADKAAFPALERALLTLKLQHPFRAKASGREMKLYTGSKADYDKVKEAVEGRGLPHHSYALEPTPKLHFAIRGLVKQTDLSRVQEDLVEQGFTPSALSRKTRGETELPLVLVELPGSADGERFMRLTQVAHQVIKVERELPRGVPICARCLRYRHTKNHCQREPRCAICTKAHPSWECPEPETPPRCVHCKEAGHKSTYKGCPAYQQFVGQSPAVENPVASKPPPATASATTTSTVSATVSHGKSYASATKKGHPPPPSPASPTTTQPLTEGLSLLGDIKGLVTLAKKAVAVLKLLLSRQWEAAIQFILTELEAFQCP